MAFNATFVQVQCQRQAAHATAHNGDVDVLKCHDVD
jgi:hypothetical protein